jgi:hypothetical protein
MAACAHDRIRILANAEANATQRHFVDNGSARCTRPTVCSHASFPHFCRSVQPRTHPSLCLDEEPGERKLQDPAAAPVESPHWQEASSTTICAAPNPIRENGIYVREHAVRAELVGGRTGRISANHLIGIPLVRAMSVASGGRIILPTVIDCATSSPIAALCKPAFSAMRQSMLACVS